MSVLCAEGNFFFPFAIFSLNNVVVIVTLTENFAITSYGTPMTQSTNITFIYGKHLVLRKM
jgi:hypothetical protein